MHACGTNRARLVLVIATIVYYPAMPRGSFRARRARGGAVLAVGAVLAFPACASAPRTAWVLTTDAPGPRPTREMRFVGSYPQALATTLDVLETDLQLPKVQARLVFVPDDETFEALLLEIGYPAPLARQAAGALSAMGGYRTVVINESRMRDRRWPGRIVTLAHELTQVLQYELGGGVRGTSAQWLREGFAEWVALQVSGALELADADEVTHLARLRVHQHGSSERLPPLSALATFPEWVAHAGGGAGALLYDYSLLVTQFLIERHGTAALLDYFGRFAEGQDERANFLAVFGETEEAVDVAIRARIWPRRGTVRPRHRDGGRPPRQPWFGRAGTMDGSSIP
jgi:hypothetical protein